MIYQYCKFCRNKGLRIVRECGRSNANWAKYRHIKKRYNSYFYIYNCEEDGCNIGNQSNNIYISQSMIFLVIVRLLLLN